MKGERICRERPSNSGLINLQITVKNAIIMSMTVFDFQFIIISML